MNNPVEWCRFVISIFPVCPETVFDGERESVHRGRWPPRVLRMDNGPEMISHALQQFCADRVGISYIPPGTPWNNGFVESFNRRLRTECLNRNHWTSLLEARVVIGDFKEAACG